MEFTVEEQSDSVLLTLTGDLTIQSATETKDLFLDVIGNANCVKLKFDALGEVDLSFVQILFAGNAMVQNAGKQLILEGECPDSLQQTITDIGYAYKQWFCFGN